MKPKLYNVLHSPITNGTTVIAGTTKRKHNVGDCLTCRIRATRTDEALTPDTPTVNVGDVVCTSKAQRVKVVEVLAV